jgi:hypothetical protein
LDRHKIRYEFNFFSLWYWVLNSRPTPQATPLAFSWFFFWGRVSQTICLGWLWTIILLICASRVARITGMRYYHLSYLIFIIIKLNTYLRSHLVTPIVIVILMNQRPQQKRKIHYHYKLFFHFYKYTYMSELLIKMNIYLNLHKITLKTKIYTEV